TALIAAEAQKADPIKQELERLQGSWLQTSEEDAGQRWTGAQTQQWNLTITGNQVTASNKVDTFVYRITIDPSKSPKTLDASAADDERLCIYRLEKDVLTISYYSRGKGRPEEFQATRKNKVVMLEFQRIK